MKKTFADRVFFWGCCCCWRVCVPTQGYLFVRGISCCSLSYVEALCRSLCRSSLILGRPRSQKTSKKIVDFFSRDSQPQQQERKLRKLEHVMRVNTWFSGLQKNMRVSYYMVTSITS